MLLTDDRDEETVDLEPNYDGQETQPTVLPAAYPNLLVNGTSGIAVGMATNMIPHNLVEVVDAARHLIAHPDATLDDLMEFVPGPDLPTGGQLLGMTEVRTAYETGRGIVRMRATAEVGALARGKSHITVTELPYGVGAERVIAKVKEMVTGKKLQGISDGKDLTDRQRGTPLVVEVKAGFPPPAAPGEHRPLAQVRGASRGDRGAGGAQGARPSSWRGEGGIGPRCLSLRGMWAEWACTGCTACVQPGAWESV